MNIWQAILMGVIQGLTEFLPVSSSGHLVLGKIFFGINIETSALFEALLHVGTLGAVFVYFWKDIKMLVVEGLKIIRDVFLLIFKKKAWEDYPERRMVLFIIISSIHPFLYWNKISQQGSNFERFNKFLTNPISNWSPWY